jgi:nucleoid-associated protein YgaU
MITRDSRYAGVGTAIIRIDGREVTYLRTRFITPPAGGYAHTVTGDERLDIIAYRYYGDPARFWRIADANDAMDPEDLLELGRTLVIPADKR